MRIRPLGSRAFGGAELVDDIDMRAEPAVRLGTREQNQIELILQLDSVVVGERLPDGLSGLPRAEDGRT